MTKRSVCSVLSVFAITGLFGAPASAQPADAPRDHPSWGLPVLDGDALVYPEGAAIPRVATSIEKDHADSGAFTPTLRGVGTPDGPLFCPPEYAPMEGILIAWEGPNAWTTILAQMTGLITTTGNAKVFCIVDNAGEEATATSAMTNQGADMARVEFFTRNVDSIWMRDYGPRFVYEGGVRVILDHTYNVLSRVNDNALPDYFSVARGLTQYQLPLRHGGGNYHLDALGEGYATRLITNENGNFSEAQIIQLWRDYWGLETTLFTPFPTNVDGTQHIDMWMQVIDDDKVMISDWPTQSGSIQDQICDDAAALLASRGFTVFRPPAIRIGSGFSGAHYTYTNVVMCNDLVIVPSYTHPSVSGFNAQALSVWQSAMPDKSVVMINCEGIVDAAGVIHCIVMHVPAPLGGENPSVYLKSPNGGESFDPGDTVLVSWVSDDDDARPPFATVQLSTDDGQNYTDVASIGNIFSYTWTVPDVFTTQARLRVVIGDRDGNEGDDESDAAFTINGTPVATCAADWNNDGFLNDQDFFDFSNDFFGGTGPQGTGDFNADGFQNDQDFFDFVNDYFTPPAGC